MLREDDLIGEATDYTNKEVFAHAWKTPEQRELETADDDDGVGFALDNSGDRSQEKQQDWDGVSLDDSGARIEEDDEEQSEVDALREDNERLTKERDEARAGLNDTSRQQAAEQAEAATQFVLNNPEQAVGMIAQQQAATQQQFAMRAAESSAYGRAKYGEEDFTVACNIIGAEMQANPGYVQAMRAEIASAPNMADKVWEMAERISTRGGGRSASGPRYPASPAMNMRGFGGVGAAAAARGRGNFEDAASWTSRGDDMGSDSDVWADAWNAPHRLARDYGDSR
jgi:hypothetical protein